jgi:hypothetical protein
MRSIVLCALCAAFTGAALPGVALGQVSDSVGTGSQGLSTTPAYTYPLQSNQSTPTTSWSLPRQPIVVQQNRIYQPPPAVVIRQQYPAVSIYNGGPIFPYPYAYGYPPTLQMVPVNPYGATFSPAYGSSLAPVPYGFGSRYYNGYSDPYFSSYGPSVQQFLMWGGADFGGW